MSNPETKLLISPQFGPNIMHNQQVVHRIRNATCLIAGVGAGILRLESYQGFAFYALVSALMSVLMHVIVTKSSPKEYFNSPLTSLWIDELVPGLAGYILSWTLLYELVGA